MKSPKHLNSQSSQNSNSKKSSSHLSSLNRFDYPIQGARKLLNTKSPIKLESLANQKKQKQDEETIRKARYYWHMRNEHHAERDKVKERQQKFQKDKQEEKKKKIMDQLVKKKAQLQKLENQRQQAIRQHGQALEKARILSQKLQIKRLKSQEHARTLHEQQKQRFNNALSKTKSQNQTKEFYVKKEQSLKRNEVKNLYKSRQREAAEQYKVEKEEYEKQLQKLNKQKQIKELQENFLKHNSHIKKGVNFENSCYHNFAKNVIVIDETKNHTIPLQKNKQTNSLSKVINEISKSKSNASPDGFQRLYTQRKSLKQQQAQQNRQKSVQRGRQALKQLKQAKQLNQYMEEMEQEQIGYNLERIEAGKKNQFTGLKPHTLRTHQKHKQERAQEEFEKIFITPYTNDKTQQYYQSNSKTDRQFDRRSLLQNRTQPTQRSNSFRKNLFSNRNSPDDHLMNTQTEEKPKNIYTLPYNTKIHSLMIEKCRPSYSRNLFQEVESNLKTQDVKVYEKARNFNENEGLTLEYSMTEDQHE